LTYNCIIPEGDEEGAQELEKLNGQPGIDCLAVSHDHPMLKYCMRNALFVWAKGGEVIQKFANY